MLIYRAFVRTRVHQICTRFAPVGRRFSRSSYVWGLDRSGDFCFSFSFGCYLCAEVPSQGGVSGTGGVCRTLHKTPTFSAFIPPVPRTCFASFWACSELYFPTRDFWFRVSPIVKASFVSLRAPAYSSRESVGSHPCTFVLRSATLCSHIGPDKRQCCSALVSRGTAYLKSDTGCLYGPLGIPPGPKSGRPRPFLLLSLNSPGCLAARVGEFSVPGFTPRGYLPEFQHTGYQPYLSIGSGLSPPLQVFAQPCRLTAPRCRLRTVPPTI